MEKLYNFKIVCRTCLSEKVDQMSLFSVVTVANTTVHLLDLIQKLCDITIQRDDGLPENLCTACIAKIKDIQDFIETSKSSDLILRLQKEREDNKIEIKEEIITIPSEELWSDSEAVDDPKSDTEDDQILKVPHNKKKYKCATCGSCFSNKVKFQKHNKVHEGNPFMCPEKDCLQTFSKKTHLSVHMRGHVGNEEKKFVCDTCGKHFMFNYLLKQHELKHSADKPFPCPRCAKGCLTADSLKRHLKIHDKNYTKKIHTCNYCNKNFLYSSLLAEHIKCHTGLKPHLCSVCGKSFRQSGALHYHQRIHTGYKPFKCEICSENFMSQSVLKIHMRKHTKEKPYVCDICGFAFRQGTDLRSHRRTHQGYKPVLCTICGKKMSTTGQLTIHLRSHTGEKPYKCPDCPKAFVTRNVLVKHSRTHTGERPYACSTCDRRFSQSSTLKTHMKTHERVAMLEDDADVRNTAENSPSRLKLEDIVNKAICDPVNDSQEEVVINELELIHENNVIVIVKR